MSCDIVQRLSYPKKTYCVMLRWSYNARPRIVEAAFFVLLNFAYLSFDDMLFRRLVVDCHCLPIGNLIRS